MSKWVFISYASEDVVTAQQICKFLEQQGFRCWLAPRDLLPSQDYAEKIIEAIEDATAVVVLLSEHANASKFVKGEIEQAFSIGHPIFTFRLQEVMPAQRLRLFLSSFHWINAWSPPLDGHVRKLAEALSELALQPEAPPPELPPLVPLGMRRVLSWIGRVPWRVMPKRIANGRVAVVTIVAVAVAVTGWEAWTAVPVRCKGREAPERLDAGTTFQDCECCPEMVVLPNGTIISRYQVTRGSYQAFRGGVLTRVVADWLNDSDRCYGFRVQGQGGQFIPDHTRNWMNPGHLQEDSSPVVCVNWYDAVEYARWLSERTGQHYRLPNLEEMSYATRAGSSHDVPWGDNLDELCRYANINDRTSREINRFPWDAVNCVDGYPIRTASGQLIQTAPIGAEFEANDYGLYHMVGNVYQWLRSDDNCTDVAGQTGIWGGSWTSAPDRMRSERSEFRYCQSKEYKAFDIGFRLVRVNE